MRWIQAVVLGLVVAVVSACGSSGRGGDTGGVPGGDIPSDDTSLGYASIAVTPAQISTSIARGGASLVPVQVDFVGDGVLVGFPANQQPVSWLNVNISGDRSPLRVYIEFNASLLDTGTHRTTLRFVTGIGDSDDIAYKDVPISLTVRQGLELSSTSDSLYFEGKAGLTGDTEVISVLAVENWRLQVEYFQGEPGWLGLSQTAGLAQPGRVPVEVAVTGASQGYHSASINLIDDQGNVQSTLPVNYHVTGAPLLMAEAFKVITGSANLVDLQWPISVLSDYGSAGLPIMWSAQSNASWLELDNAMGSLSGDTSLSAHINPQALLALGSGTHTATISVSFAGNVIRPLITQVSVAFDFNPELSLDNATFSVGATATDEALTQTVDVVPAVGSAFAGLLNVIEWTAASTTAWLSVSPASGTGPLTLTVDKAALANLANGYHEAKVALTSPDPQVGAGEATVTLKLALPAIERLGPYVVYADEPGNVAVFGSGFEVGEPLSVSLQGEADTIVITGTADAETVLSLPLPNDLDAGNYHVVAPNALGIARSSARLAVKQPVTYIAESIDLPKDFTKITLDAERQALVLTGWQTNELYRLQLDEQGRWLADSFALVNLNAAELTADGSQWLAAAASTGITDTLVQLNANTLAIEGTDGVPSHIDSYASFDLLLPLLDGSIFVINSDQWPTALNYPGWEPLDIPSVYGTETVMSRDRSRFIGVSSLFVGDTYSYDLRDGQFTPRNLFSTSSRRTHIDMSRDASRIVGNSSVLNANYQLLGSLTPLEGIDGVAVSPNGKSVIAKRIVNTSNGSHIVFSRHDISAPTGPYPADAQSLPLTVPEGTYISDMKVSDDGKALFVLARLYTGNSNVSEPTVLYVVPLEEPAL